MVPCVSRGRSVVPLRPYKQAVREHLQAAVSKALHTHTETLMRAPHLGAKSSENAHCCMPCKTNRMRQVIRQSHGCTVVKNLQASLCSQTGLVQKSWCTREIRLRLNSYSTM
jgi:hypothetical protein